MGQARAETILAGRYQLGPVIGHGGMGEVREAWDMRLERPVAVKLLRADIAGDTAARGRFDTEARAAARLVHPNIVAIFDTGDSGGPQGVPYIVMERLPGETFRDAMDSGSLTPESVRTAGLEVLSALDAAHKAGLVHRDIKPSNILASELGRWKVGDFGIAKSLDPSSGADQTMTGLVIGTPAYLAPERLHGRPATHASDLFSVGVVLYEALTGQRPFHVSDSYPWSSAAAGVAATPIREIRPEIDPGLASVVDRSLSPDPAQRFGSAAEMRAALAGFGAPVVGSSAAATAAFAATGSPVGSTVPLPASTAVGPTEPAVPGNVFAGHDGDTEVLPRRRAVPAGFPLRRVVVAAIAGVAAFVLTTALIDSGGHHTAHKPPATTTAGVTATTTAPTTTPPPTTTLPTTPAPPPAPPAHHHKGHG